MRGGRALLCLWLACAGGPTLAQAVVSSPRPDRVAVTVYRDPNRSSDEAFDLDYMGGFALISETRAIAIPAGTSEIRFEGVAGGIVPQSAIVTGLPEGLIERNRDAFLLSAASLLERSLGRRVHLRRTSRATGAVVEQDAIVRSGAGGALVLQTAAGFEALRCTGLAETPVYDEVPPGLSARPTLSVRARASRAVSATVTLSYIASNFDWQANYVATLSSAGDRLDLFAWLTLANGDETGFVDADTQAVAGHVNRGDERGDPPEADELELRCWPAATTSDIPLEEFVRQQMGRGRALAREESIVVTGSRIPSLNLTSSSPVTVVMSAELEALGDLKLYRIPERVTVAAHSQKQVALLHRSGVRVRTVYRAQPAVVEAVWTRPARRVLTTRNRDAEGLGIPLPAGVAMVFADSGERPILIGQGMIRDHAVGEDVELEIGPAPSVMTRLTPVSRVGRDGSYELFVTNDRAQPIDFEAEIFTGGRVRADRHLSRRRGRPLWTVTVPANGSATLRYRVTGS